MKLTAENIREHRQILKKWQYGRELITGIRSYKYSLEENRVHVKTDIVLLYRDCLEKRGFAVQILKDHYGSIISWSEKTETI